MANFDFKNLYLVNPCELNDECYSRAMHAYEILDNSKIFKTFKDSIKDIDYLIATSSIESTNDKRHLRNAVILEDLAEKIHKIDGKIGILFGREDYGLFNTEIASSDILLKIPTSDSYPFLNLSHSVCLVLYTLYIKQKYEPREKITIGNIEKEKLYDYFSELLKQINYPEHKKENTEIMFKRIMGRAMPSKWEYHTLMGVFNKSIEKIKDKKN